MVGDWKNVGQPTYTYSNRLWFLNLAFMEFGCLSQKILRIRYSEIEGESDYDSLSQHNYHYQIPF